MGRMSYLDIGLQFEKNYHLARQDYYEDHKPIYFYHISAFPLHKYEDQPFSMKPKHIFAGESEVCHIRRICVAPTMEQCIAAIVPGFSDKLYVYRTVRKSNKSVIPHGVVDAPITQERWLTRERKFKLVGTITRPDNCEYHMLASDENETHTVRVDFDHRGAVHDFEYQHKELTRLRKFFRTHDKNVFLNDTERVIHTNQRDMKLGLNRKYDFNRLRTSSSH